MSLFDATVSQVVKDVSDKTLVPVANRSAADYCKIFSLVQRKTKSWHLPWKSPYKFIPAELTLNDILVEPVDVKNLSHSTVLFQKYESTPSFHKSGKIGGKIADEFEVDVSVNETVQVLLKLGSVMKQEILWQKLYETVNGKKVHTNHPLMKTINSNSKKSLFLIGMVVTSGSTSSLDKDLTIGGDIDGSPHVALNLNTNGSSESKQHRQYIIPRGTTLAYSCYRLKIDNIGNNISVLNLQLGDDLTDSPLVNQKETFEVEHVQRVLSGLLSNKVSNDLIQLLRNILKTTPTCAFRLNIVVENAIDCWEAEYMPCKITVDHLLKLFPEDCSKDCFKFLEMSGFQIDKEKNKVIYPENLDLLTSLNVLLDNLSEMSNEQIQRLVGCDLSHKSGILLAIQNAINTKDGSKSDMEFSEIFTDNHPVARFLRSIGLDMIRSDTKICVEYLPKNQSVLQLGSSFVAVHGMCSV